MKNFLPLNTIRRRCVYYYKLNDAEKALFKDEKTDLKIELTYTLGGMNYFSGNTNPRGYKLYLTPVACNGNGMESSILLGDQFDSGFYVGVETADRYNAKRLGQLAEIFDIFLADLAKFYLARENGKLVEFVADLVGKTSQPKITAAPKVPQANLCSKTVKRENAYEVWQSYDGSWTWYVLKKYQTPEKEKDNPYARWFCDVVTPMCPDGEMGDVYVKDIIGYARRIKGLSTDLKAVLADRPQIFDKPTYDPDDPDHERR